MIKLTKGNIQSDDVAKLGFIEITWVQDKRPLTHYILERDPKVQICLSHGGVVICKSKIDTSLFAHFDTYKCFKEFLESISPINQNHLVKFRQNRLGEQIDPSKMVWCLMDNPKMGHPESVCLNRSTAHLKIGKHYNEKTLPEGGVTCPNCLEKIKWFQTVKL